MPPSTFAYRPTASSRSVPRSWSRSATLRLTSKPSPRNTSHQSLPSLLGTIDLGVFPIDTLPLNSFVLQRPTGGSVNGSISAQAPAQPRPPQHPPGLDALEHSPLRRHHDLYPWRAVVYRAPFPLRSHSRLRCAGGLPPDQCVVECRSDHGI